MKKLQTILLTLCAIFFAACSNDKIVEELIPQQPVVETPKGITTLHATIEQMTRTAVGEEAADHSAKITWQAGDQILAFGEGGTGKAIYEIADTTAAENGTFTLADGQTALSAITAANYPAKGASKGDFNLSVQVYNSTANAFPAYMTADAATATNELTFKHAVAYICVNLKADRLDEILLRGTGIVTGDAVEDEWITLLCNQTEPFTTDFRQFFIAMQPKESIDLSIVVNKGQNAAKKVVTAKTFEKKHVYRATADYPAADIPTGWEKLRNRFGLTSFEGIVIGKLAWAPVNCGYEIDPAHLDWGEQDKRRGRFYSGSDVSAIPEGWRLPTHDEYTALCNGITNPHEIMVTTHNYARPIGWYLDGTGVAGKKGVHFDAPTPGHSDITNECRLWTDKTGAFWTSAADIFVFETGDRTSPQGSLNSIKFYSYLDGAWRFAIRAVKTAETEGLEDNGNGTGTLNGHAWVDLGIRTTDGKRLVFADRNIGAENPEDAGLYFWWGDVVGYELDASNNTTFAFNSANINIATYNKTLATLKTDGWIDDDNNLTPEHDAATVQWGEGWRMLRHDEISKLSSSTGYVTESDATVETGAGTVAGKKFVGKGDYADKSIFIPRAGDVEGTSLQHTDLYLYWTATASTNYGNTTAYRHMLSYGQNGNRDNGYPIRPVAVIK